MKLTEHFSLEELTGSDTALRMGIDNTPGEDITVNLSVAANGMEKVREVLGFPVHVTCAYRCEILEKVLAKNDYIAWCSRHGKAVCDAAWGEYFARKAHPKGFAVDFVCPQFGAPQEVVDAIVKSGIKYDQVIMEGTWVHISFAPEMRGIYLLASFANGVPSYTQVTA